MFINILFCEHLTGLSHRIMALPRKIYHKEKAKRNRNLSPTIICNNCTGGVMLHDLGLRFNTPTVNTLFYSFEDFLYFSLHIKEYQCVELLEEKNTKFKYPVGSLFLKGRKIQIGLVHYKTFEEGKSKWENRFRRIDFKNIFFVYESPSVDEHDISAFCETFPINGMIISKKNESIAYKNYVGKDFYNLWYPGKILDYKSSFSVKRFLDEVDYVSFLNS